MVVSNLETKKSKYTTAQIEKVLGKKSPAKMMNKETNAPDPSSKNSLPKSGPIPTGSCSSSENEEHALLTLSRMNLPMAPDEDSAIVEANDRIPRLQDGRYRLKGHWPLIMKTLLQFPERTAPSVRDLAIQAGHGEIHWGIVHRWRSVPVALVSRTRLGSRIQLTLTDLGFRIIGDPDGYGS